jgi:hypothetical protein
MEVYNKCSSYGPRICIILSTIRKVTTRQFYVMLTFSKCNLHCLTTCIYPFISQSVSETIQGGPPFTCYTLLLMSNPYTSLHTVCRENFSTNALFTKTPRPTNRRLLYGRPSASVQNIHPQAH